MWARSLVLGTTAMVVVITACQRLADPSGDLPADIEPIQTQSSTYELRTEGDMLRTEIPYTFTNRTGGQVYLVNCRGSFGVRLERLTESGWQTAWSPIMQMCLGPPIVIGQGSTFNHTLHVEAGIPGANIEPKFDFDDPSGTHRIVWTSALSSYDDRESPFGPQIPLEARVSNGFRLELR